MIAGGLLFGTGLDLRIAGERGSCFSASLYGAALTERERIW
jgi:hypothetical protein